MCTGISPPQPQQEQPGITPSALAWGQWSPARTSLQCNNRAKLPHPTAPGYPTTLWFVPSTHLAQTQHLHVPCPPPQSRGYQGQSQTLLCTSQEHSRSSGPSPAVSLPLGSNTATSGAAPHEQPLLPEMPHARIWPGLSTDSQTKPSPPGDEITHQKARSGAPTVSQTSAVGCRGRSWENKHVFLRTSPAAGRMQALKPNLSSLPRRSAGPAWLLAHQISACVWSAGTRFTSQAGTLWATGRTCFA